MSKTETKQAPAEVFSPASYITEEMAARGWSELDVAIRMGGLTVDLLSLQFALHVDDPELEMGQETAEGLARAFGNSAEFWLETDRQWRQRGR